jgi:hypothetical protein
LINNKLKLSNTPFFFDNKKICYSELKNFKIFNIDLNTCKIKAISTKIDKIDNGDYLHINLEKLKFEKSKTPYYFDNNGNIKLRQIEPVLYLNDLLTENNNRVNYAYVPIRISDISKNKLLLKNEIDGLFNSNISKSLSNNNFIIFYIDLKKKNTIKKINKVKALQISNSVEAKINKISDKKKNISDSTVIDNSKKYIEHVNFELESN